MGEGAGPVPYHSLGVGVRGLESESIQLYLHAAQRTLSGTLHTMSFTTLKSQKQLRDAHPNVMCHYIMNHNVTVTEWYATHIVKVDTQMLKRD